MKNRLTKVIKRLVTAFCVLAFLGVTITSSSAHAQKAKKRKRPTRVLRLEELVVRGRIHKPEAMIILQRSVKARIFEENARKKKFVDRILASVNDPNLE